MEQQEEQVPIEFGQDYHEPNLVVDRAILADGELRGYRDGALVVRYAGAEDYSHIVLYDENGDPVAHERAGATLEEKNRADIDYIAIMTGVEL